MFERENASFTSRDLILFWPLCSTPQPPTSPTINLRTLFLGKMHEYLFVLQMISGKSVIPWQPRLASNPKRKNPDLQADRGYDSCVFLSTSPLRFFWQKELHACKMIIIITHTLLLTPNSPPWSSIQKMREKGGDASRKKEREGVTQLHAFHYHCAGDPPPGRGLPVTQLNAPAVKRRSR